jgi:hypothetical protein
MSIVGSVSEVQQFWEKLLDVRLFLGHWCTNSQQHVLLFKGAISQFFCQRILGPNRRYFESVSHLEACSDIRRMDGLEFCSFEEIGLVLVA